MKRIKLMFAATLLCAGALTVSATSEAAKQCPREGILCTTQYDPVICNNGKIYSNSCFAYVDCATGCTPYNNVV